MISSWLRSNTIILLIFYFSSVSLSNIKIVNIIPLQILINVINKIIKTHRGIYINMILKLLE